MHYISTRATEGQAAPKRFCEILLEGLAPDGGLYLPKHYPQVDDATLTRWRGLPYADLAFELLSTILAQVIQVFPYCKNFQSSVSRSINHL